VGFQEIETMENIWKKNPVSLSNINKYANALAWFLQAKQGSHCACSIGPVMPYRLKSWLTSPLKHALY
jgi:hypothetical protein